MLIAGRYEVREHIATGGMASVFKTWDHRVQRLVAMKVLRSLDKNDLRAVERFRREARALRRATVGTQSPEPTHNRNKSCVTIAARIVSACVGAPASQLLDSVEAIQSQQFQLRRADARAF